MPLTSALLCMCLNTWRLQVTKEKARQALDDQYGGQDEPSTAGGYNPSYRGTKFSNAYMLVYVRESEWDSIMCEVRVLHLLTKPGHSLAEREEV